MSCHNFKSLSLVEKKESRKVFKIAISTKTNCYYILAKHKLSLG